MVDTVASSSPAVPKRRVAAWALWDAGSAGINAITTTFVFNLYLTSTAFQDPHYVATHTATQVGANASAQFGVAVIVASVFVALLAPALGRQSDGSGRRKVWLGVSTAVVVLALFSLFFVQAQPSFLLYGLIMFSIGTVAYEIAFVQYNAMLSQISTPKNVGRISGIGWASGYIAGIVLLLIVYVGLVAGSGGLLHVSTANGLNIRIVEVVAGVWTLIFSIPVLVSVPELPKNLTAPRVGFFQSYVQLIKLIGSMWRTDRNTLRFLIASAVFRDGLSGVFGFGAIIAGKTFGFSMSEVLIFGIAANVVAGIATALVGLLDDKLGPRAVMFISLIGLVVAGLGVFIFHDSGQVVFWIGGLILCLFVGPAQSASRSFLTRVTPPERQGAAFGLYATTGRAATFLAPVAFTTFVAVGGATFWGMLGIVLIILIGLILLFFVKKPTEARFYAEHDDLVPSK
jgi:UMF1 family MFS transporter